jgi:hypothetical protein
MIKELNRGVASGGEAEDDNDKYDDDDTIPSDLLGKIWSLIKGI